MVDQIALSRRSFLRTFPIASLALWQIGAAAGRGEAARFREPAAVPYEHSDDTLLDELERAAFVFFWEQAHGETGQVRDRASAIGEERRREASIAATGFGLTALCIADSREYARSGEIALRVRQTLRFLKDKLPHEHGFFYHFIDFATGERAWNSEVSPIDTSLLLCGVLTARQHFADAEIQDLATAIYERVDWPWMLNRGQTFAMAWRPGEGFSKGRWSHYCELMMMYLLALGSPTQPVPSATWKAWKRPRVKFQDFEYISGHDPLFVHQYSHAWFDFRHKRDDYADYFENSVTATKAHKQFCLSLRGRFPDYSELLWGITASDSPHGYEVWGGPPRLGRLDGSVVPCAAAGSLPFLYRECVDVLRTIRERYGRAWSKYGFVDAFNPLTNWYSSDVLGIDLGISMLMAENQRSGFVWNTFMKNKEAQRGMERAGFRASSG